MPKIKRRNFASTAGIMLLTAGLVAGCTAAPSGEESDTSFVVSTFEPGSLVPGNTWAQYIAGVMFTPLMVADPATGVPTPAAAESVETDDQQTWTIRLKEGWTFHD